MEDDMIRLIASDIDDTLLPEGTFDLSLEFFDIIRALKDKGILFAAASGRHSSSIRRLFEPVMNDVVIIAGNGSCVMYQGRVLDVKPLDYGFYLEMAEVMKRTDPSMILADHAECVWTDSEREDLISWIRDGYRVSLKRCSDVSLIQAPVMKIAMHVENDAAVSAARIRDMFPGRANIMAAGARWVDVVSNEADKGLALEGIQHMLGISPEETAAFGDNGNDISMLRLAGESYAVANAREEVKAAAGQVIGPMSEGAVLEVMKQWL